MQPLRYPRYRLALGISTLSWIALWLTNIAIVAGMLQGGRSTGEIGLFQGAWMIATPLAVIAGGLVTDRFGPTISLRLGLAMEIAGMLLMGVSFTSNTAPLPPLLLAAMLVGGSDGLSSNGLNVLAGGVVPRELMSAAIGMLLLGLAAGRIVGGTVAGPAVDTLGASGALFMCAGLVTISWLLTLVLGRVRLSGTGTEAARSYVDLRPAIRWYRATPDARTVLTVGALMAVLVYGYFALLPVVVGQALGTDTGSQGLAMAVGGVGVAVGALTMGPISRRIGVGRLLVLAVFGSTMGLALLAFGTTGAVILLAVTFLPTFTNVQSASSNVVLQTLAPPAMRGRVVGLYSMVFAALLPVGTVTAGWLGERLGVRETLILLAVAMATLTIGLVARRRGMARDLAVVAAASDGPAT